jgi:hypothetical protein
VSIDFGTEQLPIKPDVYSFTCLSQRFLRRTSGYKNQKTLGPQGSQFRLTFAVRNTRHLHHVHFLFNARAFSLQLRRVLHISRRETKPAAMLAMSSLSAALIRTKHVRCSVVWHASSKQTLACDVLLGFTVHCTTSRCSPASRAAVHWFPHGFLSIRRHTVTTCILISKLFHLTMTTLNRFFKHCS